MGQVHTGRVTRVAEFGAFVELEPGIEGLAHASTFAPTGRHGGWSKSVAAGLTGAFEILSIDTAQKRIGVALIEEGSAFAASPLQRDRSSRAAGATPPPDALAPGAIVTGKIERHEREQAELREYAARPDAEPAASMGSIADKLRGALGRE